MTRPRVLFVSQSDPTDRSAWSGTVHQMWSSLRDLADLEVVVLRAPFGVYLADRFIRRLGRRAELLRSSVVLRSYARQIARAPEGDFIFSPSSLPLAYVPPGVPCAFWTDATFPLLADYDPKGHPLTGGAMRRGVAAEVRALGRARAVYASEWAAASARELNPSAQIRVHAFGPNLPQASIDRVRAQRSKSRAESRTAGDPIVLWIGVEWVRKGGDLAVAAVEELRHRGKDARLILIGVPPREVPASVRALPFVECLGRLDKTIDAELRELEHAFSRADVLLLPSTAEAAGIVVSEAALCGLPSVVSDVGGLGETVVRSGVGIAVTLGPGAVGRLAQALTDSGHVQISLSRIESSFSYTDLFQSLLSWSGVAAPSSDP